MPTSSTVAHFVDSNVPMYLVGGAHPARDRLVVWLHDHRDALLVTSAEVYQEIIHRYVAIDRRAAIADAFAALDALAEIAHPVTRDDVGLAHEIALRHRALSGRDCLHVAVMERHAVAHILSMDAGFDHVPGLSRLP